MPRPLIALAVVFAAVIGLAAALLQFERRASDTGAAPEGPASLAGAGKPASEIASAPSSGEAPAPLETASPEAQLANGSAEKASPQGAASIPISGEQPRVAAPETASAESAPTTPPSAPAGTPPADTPNVAASAQDKAAARVAATQHVGGAEADRVAGEADPAAGASIETSEREAGQSPAAQLPPGAPAATDPAIGASTADAERSTGGDGEATQDTEPAAAEQPAPEIRITGTEASGEALTPPEAVFGGPQRRDADAAARPTSAAPDVDSREEASSGAQDAESAAPSRDGGSGEREERTVAIASPDHQAPPADSAAASSEPESGRVKPSGAQNSLSPPAAAAPEPEQTPVSTTEDVPAPVGAPHATTGPAPRDEPAVAMAAPDRPEAAQNDTGGPALGATGQAEPSPAKDGSAGTGDVAPDTAGSPQPESQGTAASAEPRPSGSDRAPAARPSALQGDAAPVAKEQEKGSPVEAEDRSPEPVEAAVAAGSSGDTGPKTESPTTPSAEAPAAAAAGLPPIEYRPLVPRFGDAERPVPTDSAGEAQLAARTSLGAEQEASRPGRDIAEPVGASSSAADAAPRAKGAEPDIALLAPGQPPRDAGEADRPEAANAPGEPPREPASAAAPAEPEKTLGEISIRAAEVEVDTLYVAGEAPPGALVRVYADDDFVGEAEATDKGAWLVQAKKPIPVGEVLLRADAVAPGTDSPIGQAELPFVRYSDGVVLEPVAAADAAGPSSTGSIPPPVYVIIRRGDNLWRLSRRNYGRGVRYQAIFAANRDQIRNPNLIYPGQIFVVPTRDRSWETAEN
jgi:nucleoid-associated protein YgaU